MIMYGHKYRLLLGDSAFNGKFYFVRKSLKQNLEDKSKQKTEEGIKNPSKRNILNGLKTQILSIVTCP